MSRRTVLLAGLAGLGGLAGSVPLGGCARVRQLVGDEGPAGVIPDVPEGEVRLERVSSAARGRTVGFFTAVPDGFGRGSGLPVCLVLHGASATTADFQQFGFGRFLTAAVRAGVPPFVLAGADGGRTFWEGGPGDDPQRMLREEIPAWCADRGYDATRLGGYGWSMGGYGVLRMAQTWPVGGTSALRVVAALSPAVREGDAVFSDVQRLSGDRVGLWCGRSDSLYPAVRALAERVPGGAAVAAFDLGKHTRRYWDRITPEAFRLVGERLAGSA